MGSLKQQPNIRKDNIGNPHMFIFIYVLAKGKQKDSNKIFKTLFERILSSNPSKFSNSSVPWTVSGGIV